jgi:hypothetical protein
MWSSLLRFQREPRRSGSSSNCANVSRVSTSKASNVRRRQRRVIRAWSLAIESWCACWRASLRPLRALIAQATWITLLSHTSPSLSHAPNLNIHGSNLLSKEHQLRLLRFELYHTSLLLASACVSRNLLSHFDISGGGAPDGSWLLRIRHGDCVCTKGTEGSTKVELR